MTRLDYDSGASFVLTHRVPVVERAEMCTIFDHGIELWHNCALTSASLNLVNASAYYEILPGTTAQWIVLGGTCGSH